MTKINIYKIGIFAILALPVLTLPPYFHPADWGKNIVFRSIMAVILFLFIYKILNNKNEFEFKNLAKNKIFWVLSALFGIYFLASIFSVDSRFSFWGSPYRGGGFVNFAFYFIFAILIFLLSKKEDWKDYFNFSILIAILISFVGIIQYFNFFGKIFLEASRPVATMGNPVLFATYILLLFFITLAFAIKENKKYLKVFYIFSLLIFLFTILITGSRAAYLGMAIGIIYFLLFFPKKIKVFKIGAIVLCVLIAIVIFYANTATHYPKFIPEKLLELAKQRLSIELSLNDPRFYAWSGIDYKIILDKPLLGFGPENFSVGFDKFYDPSLPYLSKEWGSWWDRAHNVLIQTASDAGIFAVLIYISLFIILFFYATHEIRATLLAYFITNFFSFDGFSTYMLFFLIIAYTLHLTTPELVIARSEATKQSKISKKIIISFSFIILIIFLWQYNAVPFFTNAEINKAEILANQKNCNEALTKMDNALKTQSFLDSYARMEYVEITKTCQKFYPEKTSEYIKKDFELMKEAVKIQPSYTRYWIALGNFASTLNLFEEANNYFNKALELAPKHNEIFADRLNTDIALKNYNNLILDYKYLIEKDPNNFQHHASLAFAYKNIGDYENAKKEALKVLELSPESKQNTEEFLKTLPF